MKRILIVCIFLNALYLHAQKKPLNHVKIVVEEGETIGTLIQKYDLDGSQCNLNHFYTLNKMKWGDILKKDQSYFLPILVYKFDDKSIRSSTNITDWTVAGRIQNYNDWLYQENVKEGDFRKDKELWVPYHEIHCNDRKTLSLPKYQTHYPIFGKKYQDVQKVSDKLSGAVYYVVGGHGGIDPGAIGKRGKAMLCEDEYAYDVCLRLARNLVANGAIVYIIVRDKDDGIRDGEILKCDTDEVSYPDESMMSIEPKVRLTQNSDAINKLYREHKRRGVGYQRMITVHVDSRSVHEHVDIFFYHKIKNDFGKKLAYKIHEVVKEKYAKTRPKGGYDGTVSSRDLHMLREVLPISVFVELANIQNASDQERIVKPYNRQAIADWFLEALLSDYKK